MKRLLSCVLKWPRFKIVIVLERVAVNQKLKVTINVTTDPGITNDRNDERQWYNDYNSTYVYYNHNNAFITIYLLQGA